MNKNLNKNQESGRSMIEMLGVLAVIGVLSVAGIAGYTTAMNKHRANEILNAASVRAMVVSTQLQKNKDATPTLVEFGTESVQGVTYGTPAKMGEKQFKIPLSGSGLTTAVCSQLKNIAGDDGSGTVRVVSDCSRFVFNNDLSKGVTDAGNTNKENDGSCKAGTYGSDCENNCPEEHQVANSNNDGCDCATGYIGEDCSECDEGYEWNGASCEEYVAPAYYASPKRLCHYGCSQYDDVPLPYDFTWQDGSELAASITCPSGGHWASLDEFNALKTSGKFPSNGDGNYYWLKTCYNNNCETGRAWVVYDDGSAGGEYRNDGPSRALCIY